MKTGDIIYRLLQGSRRTGIIAITSRCNCRCQMCNIYDNEPVDIKYSDMTRILDFMAANKFLIAYFTGGEPSLHPDLSRIVKYADSLGLITSLTTNGTISASSLEELKKAGLYALSISVDSWDPAISETIKRHEGISKKRKRAFETSRKLGIEVYGLTYLGTHITHHNIEKMVNYVNFSLGAPFGFCYPVLSSENTYRLGQSVSMNSPENICGIVRELLKLKRKGYRIVNMTSYLEDVLRFHNCQASRFPCRAGEYVFYVDWLGDVYPCFMKKKLFNVLEEERPVFVKRAECDRCLIDCFREPSLLAYLSSPRLISKELASGSFARGWIF